MIAGAAADGLLVQLAKAAGFGKECVETPQAATGVQAQSDGLVRPDGRRQPHVSTVDLDEQDQ